MRDTGLVEPVRALFPDYESEADTAAGPVRLVVDVAEDGYAVVDAHGVRSHAATLTQLLATCEFALAQVFLSGCREHAQLHASGAVVEGSAVLALGRAGAGKSSLAVSWHRMGYAALGDDVVFVDETGRAQPFKRLYKVDAATLAQLGVDPAETCLWEPGSDEAWYDPRDGAGWGEPVPVALVAVVTYRPKAALSITPLSRAAALNALVHSQMAGTRDRRDRFEALAHVAEHAEALKVTFGSAAEAAAGLAARAP